MAQNGLFRSAMGGFNKQDVLQYIDEITAAWDAERKQLAATADEAVAARDALQIVADEAQAQAAAAMENKSVLALFSDFYRLQNNDQAPSDKHMQLMEKLVTELEEEPYEAD